MSVESSHRGFLTAAWHSTSFFNLTMLYCIQSFKYTTVFDIAMSSHRLKIGVFKSLDLYSIARPAWGVHLARLSFPAQARWSSATTEPHQPDGHGGVKDAPSLQRWIAYTSES